MNNWLAFAGRVLLAAIFIVSGLNKIFNFAGSQKYMAMHGIPMANIFLICAIVLEIGGSLSILFGFKAKLGALMLTVFIIPTTLIFHTNFSEQMQFIMFLKNIAILGGLLQVASFGPGAISMESCKSCCKSKIET